MPRARSGVPCADFLEALANVVMGLAFDLLPLLSFVPASLQAVRQEPRRDAFFWAAIVVAAGGPVARVAVYIAGGHGRRALLRACGRRLRFRLCFMRASPPLLLRRGDWRHFLPLTCSSWG